MSFKNTLPVFIGLCAGAVVFSLVAFFNGEGVQGVLGIAIIMLACALFIIVYHMTRTDRNSVQDIEFGPVIAEIKKLAQQVSALEAGLARPAMPVQLASPAGESEPEAASLPGTGKSPVLLDDARLDVFLEPVVDAATRQTMFYRAGLSFVEDDGVHTPMPLYAVRIDEQGLAADIDMKLFHRIAPVIERLNAAGRPTGIICPVSQKSFASRQFLEELTRYLHKHPVLAQKLVIEISQKSLAALSEAGMGGLAFLAQVGAIFSLGGAGLESPDLAALATLGFRYIDIDIDENIALYGHDAFQPGKQAGILKTMAQASNISIIGAGLKRESQFAETSQALNFARGPLFSPPRLVKRNLTDARGAAKAA